MPNVLLSVLRTGAQALVGYLATWLASHGLDVPVDDLTMWAQVLIVGGGIAAFTAALRWLETRTGDSIGARAARGLARLLMLGLSGKQPVYVEPDQRLRVIGPDGVPRTPR